MIRTNLLGLRKYLGFKSHKEGRSISTAMSKLSLNGADNNDFKKIAKNLIQATRLHCYSAAINKNETVYNNMIHPKVMG